MASDGAAVEIWSQLESSNRLLRRIAYAMAALALLTTTVASWLGLVALQRPVVYYVDSNGAAKRGERVSSAGAVEVEARHIAREFLDATVAISSLTIEEDLAKAWNLMTDELQGKERAELSAYEQQSGQSFVDFVKKQSIRSELTDLTISVKAHKGGRAWLVAASGRARTWPLSMSGEEAGVVSKDFEVKLTLVSVARTELTPNGLLVAHRVTRFFDSKSPDALERVVPIPSARHGDQHAP